MSLFKRKRKREPDAETEDGSAADLGAEDAPDTGGDSTGTTSETPPAGVDRSEGPYDVSEVDGVEGRLDVGALWLPLVADLEVQLQMDEASGQVTGAFLVHEGSAVQLQAFAAPRHESIWREICDEIAAGITAQGGTADPGEGPFGYELLARVPAQQPDGKTGFQPLRFTGVDGPRWFLRAVFHGEAAIDREAAAALEAVVRQVVVNRGPEPMGPRELLPLHLPVGVEGTVEDTEGHEHPDADAVDEQGPGSPADDGGTVGGFDDLKPFERGPEITERR